MSPELKQFIQDNRNLINQNSKESWEEIYTSISPVITGEFTKIMLSIGIDPAKIMGYIPEHYLSGRSNIREYVISSEVTSIGGGAFYDCDSLTSVVIPDSVTSIGIGAFGDCGSLTSVVIGNGVTSIGEDAFYNCTSLKSVEIGDSVTSIGSWAFRYCSSLTSVTIGNCVTSIGSNAFSDNNNLKEIHYKGTKKDALTKLKVRDEMWRKYSSIEKIICIDGEINL